MNLWTVAPEWKGATVFIVAGGDSIRSQQQPIDRLRGRKVIAINSSFLIVPFADYCIFSDSRWWWHWHDGADGGTKEQRRQLLDFAGRFIAVTPSISHRRVLNLRKKRIGIDCGLTSDRTRAAVHKTTLTAAMNVAAHLGASRIVLLGADMRRGVTGRDHHHKPHPWRVKPGCWDRQMMDLRYTIPALEARSIEVINTSEISLIDWWPKRALETLL